ERTPFLGTLKVDQVERKRRLAQRRQDRMRLAAMMRLMVEEMRQRRRKSLRYRPHVCHGDIGEASSKILVAEAVDPRHDPRILRLARRTQRRQIRMQDRVELRGGRAFARKALQPYPVGNKHMV